MSAIETRIYLDNAATSFPKPAAVYDAVDRYNRSMGVAVGRGAFAQAIEVQGTIDRCRKRAADVLGAASPDRIVFSFNGTDSLNIALHGALHEGDHVVTSVAEHNSVLRPLKELQDRCGIEVTYVGVDADGKIDPAEIKAAIRSHTKMVALIHASNVTGTLQPIADAGEIAHAAGALFLVDAAQTAGHIPINVQDSPIDVLCCPGHKGLLGPLGTGLLYLRPGIEEQIASFRQGGTGSHSEQDRQPDSLPDKYESGNHNAPGLYGLEAAMDYLANRGIEAIGAHEHSLTARLLDGLREISGLRVFGPMDPARRVGVVSVALREIDPQELAGILDDSFGIQTRAGLHCAPRIHEAMGTTTSGGTVRISPGPFTTEADIDRVVTALRELAANLTV